MDLPLEKRLRKRLHVDVGRLQDEVMEAAYALDGGLVFHGGTAIWRCFSGNRFSEDLDLYCARESRIAEGLESELASRSLVLAKLKKTGNLIFAKVSDGRAEVRLELNLAARKKGNAMRYERMNGSGMDVLCLSAEELIIEKTEAYKNRRFVRDLYDVYHLSGLAAGSAATGKAIASLLRDFKPPVDEKNLSVIVYSGAIPSTGQMLLALRRRLQ
ncbi:MAG: nucleotidyl transferase AbiEii/AbiGii toxin family protein [Candidatus Micrarchaeia archaeon]